MNDQPQTKQEKESIRKYWDISGILFHMYNRGEPLTIRNMVKWVCEDEDFAFTISELIAVIKEMRDTGRIGQSRYERSRSCITFRIDYARWRNGCENCELDDGITSQCAACGNEEYLGDDCW